MNVSVFDRLLFSISGSGSLLRLVLSGYVWFLVRLVILLSCCVSHGLTLGGSTHNGTNVLDYDFRWLAVNATAVSDVHASRLGTLSD